MQYVDLNEAKERKKQFTIVTSKGDNSWDYSFNNIHISILSTWHLRVRIWFHITKVDVTCRWLIKVALSLTSHAALCIYWWTYIKMP